MKTIRQLVALCTAFIIILCTPSFVSANDNNASELVPVTEEELTANNSITVSLSNLSSVVKDYDIPVEVAECIAEKLANATAGEVVSVLIPYSAPNDGSVSQKASSGSWSPIRNYNGYQLTDWVVTIQNAYSMTSIRSSAYGNNILAFCDTIIASSAGTVLGRITPFGSAGVTACQYILGLETNLVTPTSGDKVQAAPNYICYDTFTYVQTSEGKLLGAHTSAASVRSISWYAYCAQKDKVNIKTVSYNRMIESLNYDNRSAKAVQWYSLGGWSDDPVELKIGDIRFTLE